VETNDWSAQDAMAFNTASDLQRKSLARLAAGTPDGVNVDGMLSVWPLIVVDPARPLPSRGIDPDSPPTTAEILHLDKYGQSFIYDVVDNQARSKARAFEDMSPKARLEGQLKDYLGTDVSFRVAAESNMQVMVRLVFGFSEATSVDGVSILENPGLMAWFTYQLTSIMGQLVRDERHQTPAEVMRINVACASNHWLLKQLTDAKVMSAKEMYDCYQRTVCIMVPHLHGHGMNTEKGIRRSPLSCAHTQNEEKTMAQKRQAAIRGSTKGGFKPRGHVDDDPTEAILREFALQNAAHAIVGINHMTRQGENSSRANERTHAISQWMAKPDCPLNFDIVVPDFMLSHGTPGHKWMDTFLERRSYQKGIHYDRVVDVGYVFHVVSPLGTTQTATAETAPREAFVLPEQLLALPIDATSEWTVERRLHLDASSARYISKQTVRRVVSDEVGEFIKQLEEEVWGSTHLEQEVARLTAYAASLQPPVDVATGRVSGTGASGAMKKSDWAKELHRLVHSFPALHNQIVWTTYRGSTAALAQAAPVWPERLKHRNFIDEAGRRIREVTEEEELARDDPALPPSVLDPTYQPDPAVSDVRNAQRRRMFLRRARAARNGRQLWRPTIAQRPSIAQEVAALRAAAVPDVYFRDEDLCLFHPVYSQRRRNAQRRRQFLRRPSEQLKHRSFRRQRRARVADAPPPTARIARQRVRPRRATPAQAAVPQLPPAVQAEQQSNTADTDSDDDLPIHRIRAQVRQPAYLGLGCVRTHQLLVPYAESAVCCPSEPRISSEPPPRCTCRRCAAPTWVHVWGRLLVQPAVIHALWPSSPALSRPCCPAPRSC
jgi:hypothetical protein